MTDLPLWLFDESRVRGAIEVGITTHDDPERVARMLRSGAQVFTRRDGDDHVLTLEFSEASPEIALLREQASGITAQAPTDDDLGCVLELIRLPSGAFGQPPQG